MVGKRLCETVWDDELVAWWDKLKYLIVFCSRCPESEDNIPL